MLHSAGLGLSPAGVEAVAEAIGELGVRVERESRPLPGAAATPDPKPKPEKKRKATA